MVELLRSELLENGFAPPKVKDLFLNLKKTHNPWGCPPNQRMDWTKGLPIDSQPKTDSSKIFVCCAYSYDDRVGEAVKAAATVFQKTGLSFVPLGEEQWCCGDMSKRLGENGLSEFLAEHNIELLKEGNTKSLVSLSPHCYHTIKNDPQYRSAHVKVEHYTQTLARAVDVGRLKPVKEDKEESDLPRPVLSRTIQQRVRRAQKSARINSRAETSGNASKQKAQLLLRRRKRKNIDRRTVPL